MQPRALVPLAVALVSAFAVACDSTPRLTDFKAASSTVKAGDTLVLTAMLQYFGGDIDGGKQVVTLTPALGMPATKELPINVGGGASRAAITLSIETRGIPPGPLKVELQVVDKQGVKSNLVEVTVTIT